VVATTIKDNKCPVTSDVALTKETGEGGEVEDVLLPPSVLSANLISLLPKSKTATTFLRKALPIIVPVNP
jgi:hypothetical protein